MGRDLALVKERDVQIRADYNRLKAQETPLVVLGKKIHIRLSYQQILQALSKIYFVSTRRIEYVLGQTETTLAPLTKSAQQAT